MTGAINDITGIILSGGKNSRYGSNKAIAEVGGMRIIDNITGKFKGLFDEVIIVTNSPDEYRYLEVPMVSDIYPDKGSLGGLFTGLSRSSHEKIFVTACDMPFIDPRVIELIAGESAGYDVTVPMIAGHYEPLFAVYGKKCLKFMEEQIKNSIFQIIKMYGSVTVNVIDEKKIREIDPGFRSLININFQEDIRKYL